MATILTAIDVSDAQVSKEKDREFIVGRIDAAGGFDEVNRLVKAALRDWLAGVAREALAREEAEMEAEARAAGRAEAEEPVAMLFGLGDLRQDMGKYEQAEPLYRRSLAAAGGGARSGASKHTEQRQ